MQIVVNTRLLLKNKLDGIGWFSYQTLKRMTQAQPDVHFVFLFDRPYDEEFIFSDNITPLIIGPQARHPFLYYAWFQFSVKSILNRLQPDLFLSPDGFLSLGTQCKQLPVIHDLNFVHHPKDVRPLTSRYYNYFFPKYAKAASRIATVSEYSKQDISQTYGIATSKIDVVYNGINEGFKPLSNEEKASVRKQYSKDKPYFLFVGSQSPRKNLVRLIEAFAILKKQESSEYLLLITGANFWGESELRKAIEQSGVKEDVIFTGRIEQSELEKIMASAFALTFVPYFEGFGIPIIEAMQCGVPVICANTTCLPEIADDAALYINPFETEDIAHQMRVICRDETLRQQLIQKGFVQKEKYSWDKSANLLWESITKAI